MAYLLPFPIGIDSSNGHQNTYSWKAGGTHPTVMLSCLAIFFPENCMKMKEIGPREGAHPVWIREWTTSSPCKRMIQSQRLLAG